MNNIEIHSLENLAEITSQVRLSINQSKINKNFKILNKLRQKVP